MKKSLCIILAGLLSFSISTPAQDEKQGKGDDSLVWRTSLAQEEPVDVVSEVIEKKEIAKRDLVNLVSRIDEERIPKRHRYSTDNPFEGYMLALEDQINEDTLFYAWEDYEEGDFIIKNQALSAGWDVLVARYPKTLGRVERVAKEIKRVTTLETQKIGGYHLKINPELDSSDYLRLRLRLNSEEEDFFHGLAMRVGIKKIELGKTYPLRSLGKDVSFDFGICYDYCGDSLVKMTLKVPFWFDR